MKVNEVTEAIIGAAIEVHRTIGPGLLESAYVQCLCYELDCGYRLDLVVADAVVVEVKAVDRITPLHEAQLLTYLRLGGWKAGLLITFNVPLLRDGIVRRVLAFDES